MKTLIVGAGAMGGIVGALLAESGVDVTLYDVARAQVEAIQKNGLIIERGDRRRVVKIRATMDISQLEPVDLLIVLVKSYDTRQAVQGAMSCVTPDTSVLTLQNGVGNVEEITVLIPPRQVFAGVTSHGAMVLHPGIIRHNGGAKTFIGPVDPEQFSRAQEIAGIFNQAGIETVVTEDIQGVIWTKLTANAAINPLTATLRCPNGELVRDRNSLAIMEKIVDEVKKLASVQGIKLIQEDMLDYVKNVCHATSGNNSSMLMDILKGRRTEIDAINGRIALLGQKYGVPVPVNECLAGLVRMVESRGKCQ